MHTPKVQYLFGITIVAFILAAIPLQAHAAKKTKVESEKEKLVLMPLRVPDEDRNLTGAMETALVNGLQRKYEVYSGEQVSQKAHEIFMKESRNTAHKECDETKCMQNIAMAFQAELIATANVTKQNGSYFLALSIQNIFDNKVVYSESVPCKNCDATEVVNKLKELSGTIAPVASPPAPEEPPAKVNLSDPETALWEEAKKGNAEEDYQAYLSQYPKGKYVALAKTKLKRLKDEARAAAEQQDKEAWSIAQQGATQDSYATYLSLYPQGQFAVLAQARIDKVKREAAAAEANQRREQAAAEAKRKQEQAAEAEMQKREAGNGPAMVRIPGKNYEIGKYHVTKGEFAKFVSETGYDAGNSCYVWDGSKWDNRSGSNWRNPGFNHEDNHPVTCVNWNDAQAYAAWLSKKTGKQYRLPIESEWEYACYGGSQTEYCGSNDINAVAWYKDNSNATTHPVGQKQANGYGLYDMSGNLWQWMENKYDDKNDWRALRGGSWINNPQIVRAAYRFSYEPTIRDDDLGFRLARTLP